MSESKHHESASATSTSTYGLRPYPANSPQAKARLITLALLADGRLDSRELDELSRRKAFDQLGLSTYDFFQVLYDFCADLTKTPHRHDHYLISPELLADLLGEITQPDERRALLRLMFDVIRSDGHLAVGEARLFWNAVDAWHLSLNEHLVMKPSNLRSNKLRRRHVADTIAVA